MKRIYVALFFILILAGGLRFYKLGAIPVGFHRDEAYLGYNAYALLKTGKDMTGNLLPFHFESFLYSPGGYSYLTIPSLLLFGLSPFSVRFPAAFFGTISCLMLFYVVRSLFYESKQKDIIALLSSFFLAITPWHINLSRTATENIPVIFFLLVGLVLFLRAARRYSVILLFFSYLSYSVTLTLYQAPRAFLPLFLPLLVLLYLPKKNRKTWFMANGGMVVLFILLPIIAILSNPQLSTRMRTVSIFSTKETTLTLEEKIREDGVRGMPAIVSRLMHNKPIAYSEVVLKNFFSHLSYPFLFTDSGLPDRYRVPGAGLLYFAFLPLIFFGGTALLHDHSQRRALLFSWILLGLIGSSLTFDDVPNLQRTVFIVPAMCILTARGIQELKTINKPFVSLIFFLGTLFLGTEVIRYLYHYSVQQVVHRPWYRQEGYQQLISTIHLYEQSFSHIVITNRESAPAIFFLFFTKYDPQTYIDQISSSPLRDFDRVSFGPYTFTTNECPLLEEKETDPKTGALHYVCYANENTLYVNAGTCNLPDVCGTIVKTIERSDNTRVFTILKKATPPATVSAKFSESIFEE